MTLEEKMQKARARAAAWRKANPERYKAAIAKCKAAKPEKYTALQKRWFAEHRDGVRRKNAMWRERNPERARVLLERWNASNQKRRREIANTWRKNNQDKVNAVLARRRAAKLNATPAWANRFFMAEAYHLAKLRTQMLGFPWHVDHIVPLSHPLVCGLHVEHNLRVIPGRENQSKNNRHWPGMP